MFKLDLIVRATCAFTLALARRSVCCQLVEMVTRVMPNQYSAEYNAVNPQKRCGTIIQVHPVSLDVW